MSKFVLATSSIATEDGGAREERLISTNDKEANVQSVRVSFPHAIIAASMPPYVQSDVIDVGGGLASRGSYATASRQPAPTFAVSKHPAGVDLVDTKSDESCASHLDGQFSLIASSNPSACKDGKGMASSTINFLPSPSSVSPKYASSAVSDHSSHVVRNSAPDGWRRSSDSAIPTTRSSCHHYQPARLSSVSSDGAASPSMDLTALNHYGYCQHMGGKKPCRQRCLSGYHLCIRHILKDKSAPYRPCAYVKVHNGKDCRCRNAVHNSQKDPTHLVALGLKEPIRRNRRFAGERCSMPVTEAGVKVPYFPGLDISKDETSAVNFALPQSETNDHGAVASSGTALPFRKSFVPAAANGSEPPRKIFKSETASLGRCVVSTKSAFSPCVSSASGTVPLNNGWDAEASKKLFIPSTPRRTLSSSQCLQVGAAAAPVVSRPLPTLSLASSSATATIDSPRAPPKCVPSVQPMPADLVGPPSTGATPGQDGSKTASGNEVCRAEPLANVRHKRHISLRPKRKSCLSVGLHRHIPPIGRMCHLLEEISFYESDLFPLGLEPSDSESDEEESSVNAGQGCVASVDLHDLTACSSKSLDSIDLKLYVARRTLELQIKEWQVKAAITSNVLNACAAFPHTTAAVLEEKHSRRPFSKRVSSINRPCQHEHCKRDEGHLSANSPMLTDILQSTTERRRICEEPSLPYSCRCLSHVHEDHSQCLYVACRHPGCKKSSASGFQLSCLSHDKAEGVNGKASAATVSLLKSTLKRMDTAESRSALKEDSSHDAQLSFASAVQDLGIEVSEVSEMLSSLPALSSFCGFLDSEFGRSEEAPMVRESAPVDQTLSSVADHNWADVEQFLLSEGYRASFTALSSPPPSVNVMANQPLAAEALWSQCSAVNEDGSAAAGFSSMYDSSYARNGYDPFMTCMRSIASAGPQQLADVHPIYTAACDQYYTNNLNDTVGSGRAGAGAAGGFVGQRRFDNR